MSPDGTVVEAEKNSSAVVSLAKTVEISPPPVIPAPPIISPVMISDAPGEVGEMGDLFPPTVDSAGKEQPADTQPGFVKAETPGAVETPSLKEEPPIDETLSLRTPLSTPPAPPAEIKGWRKLLKDIAEGAKEAL